MHIALVKNHGIPYLQIMESYSEKQNGKLKNKKRTIKNIGPLSRYDDGQPEYMLRLRRSFKEGFPLIPELAELCSENTMGQRVVIELDRGNAAHCTFNPQNIGYFLLDGLYDALGIYDILNLHKSRASIGYDLNGLAKLLVFGRVLNPDSKYKTYGQRDNYLLDIVSDSHWKEVYRALDELNAKSESIQRRMNLKISNSIGRNTEICFYDVTNYYFEIGENDADGGLRKKGVSKENRNQPIVQMGLFIDDNGIPIAYRLFPGNDTDQTTLRPALEKSIDNMNFGKVVIVADGGLNNGPNIAHILDKGNGYIVSKSTKKSDKTVKAWILEEDGYLWNEAHTFKVKSKVRTRKIKDADGKQREITEKLVCFWSKNHYDRERHENEKFIEYLDSVIANPDKLKDKPKKIEKFLEKTVVDKSTGEVIKAETSLSVDMAKVQEYLDLMGYYTIMTSEIEKSEKEIIDKYHGLSRIEDSFRIIKSDLEGRPVYVRTQEHINAHFLICFIALTMTRLIQHKVLKHLGKITSNEDGWEAGLSAARIKEALVSYAADALPGGYFRLSEPTDDMKLILESLKINADLRLPALSDLRKLKYSFDKAPLI